MKKLLIYPFTKEMCPLVRYRHMLDGYELIAAIPAKGFSWENKDVSELDGGSPTGFILNESLADEIKRCDVVLVNLALSQNVARGKYHANAVILAVPPILGFIANPPTLKGVLFGGSRI